MLFNIGSILLIFSIIGGIVSFTINQPIVGIWSGIACHLGFFFFVIDGLIPEKGYVITASPNRTRFDVFDAIVPFLLFIFFSFGFWGFFKARTELLTMVSYGKVFMTISVIVWVIEMLYCYWVLIDFVRSRLKRVAY